MLVALTLNMRGLVYELFCKQATAPHWLQPVATVVTVREEVDSMFAYDPGEHIQVAVAWESEGLIM